MLIDWIDVHPRFAWPEQLEMLFAGETRHPLFQATMSKARYVFLVSALTTRLAMNAGNMMVLQPCAKSLRLSTITVARILP